MSMLLGRGIKYIVSFFILVLSATTIADDTEVFYSTNYYKPNILLVLDTSSSMNGRPVGTPTKLDILRDVITDITLNYSGLNLGLMRFNNYSGGRYLVAMDDISISGPKIRATLPSIYANAYTPLSETFYEAALSFRADPPKFGHSGDLEAFTPGGAKYISPATDVCQSNNIVLFTDGQPSADKEANSQIKQWIAASGLNLSAADPSLNLVPNCTGSGECLNELAYFLRHADQDPHNRLPGQDMHITTYTVGGFLGTNDQFLAETALSGGGLHFGANSLPELTNAFDSIFLNILERGTISTAPGVSVNTFNQAYNLDDVMFTMFSPDIFARWDGNLKKYKLDTDGSLIDANGSLVIDPSSGYVDDNAKDFFNATPANDGSVVTKGGFASLITNNRKVYTHDDGGAIKRLTRFTTGTPLSPSEISEIYDFAQSFDLLGGATLFLIGGPILPPGYVNNYIDWTVGLDAFDEDGDGDRAELRSHVVGDPLHSEPLNIVYGGTEAAPDTTTYFGTNNGFLHAVDVDNGKEHFAFIPKELLKIQKTLQKHHLTIASKRPYGLDGSPVAWINDKNRNGVILDSSSAVETDEHVYLYIGCRRGCNNYYALDVTDRSAPSLKFVIEGGVSGGAFEKLGQTWSKPVVTKVKINGSSKVVLLFGGGYDPVTQDNNPVLLDGGPGEREPDTIGNAIFMVDAKTGDRLWWASNTGSGANLIIPEMENSIPSELNVKDFNNDGYADQVFFGDLGGRVFRIDFNNMATGLASFAAGGVIAEISQDDSTPNNRKIFNKVSTSNVDDKNGAYLTIAFGTGHRPRPKSSDLVENMFVVLRDFSPFKAPTSYIKRTLSSRPLPRNTDITAVVDPDKLYDVTAIFDGGESVYDEYSDSLAKVSGFYITLDRRGEKVLSNALTTERAIMFTTYTPPPAVRPAGVCHALGEARMYAFHQIEAIPELDLDKDGYVDKNDGSTLLSSIGIPPNPVIVTSKGRNKIISVGTDFIEDLWSNGINCSDYENCNVRPEYNADTSHIYR